LRPARRSAEGAETAGDLLKPPRTGARLARALPAEVHGASPEELATRRSETAPVGVSLPASVTPTAVASELVDALAIARASP
jgi:hypothetical protein